jgi:hypothetical protein
MKMVLAIGHGRFEFADPVAERNGHYAKNLEEERNGEI